MKLARTLAFALLAGSAMISQALELRPYAEQALAAAQKADQPVAVIFHADWCPTCRIQDQVLQSMKSEPGLNLTVLVADFDTEKELKRRFGVRAQSTLVVLKGNKEAARVIGSTSPDTIRAALKAAL